MPLCEIHTADRGARGEAAKEYKRKRREERCRGKTRKRDWNAMVAATLAALAGQGRGLLDPP